jgi:hypothetical protein
VKNTLTTVQAIMGSTARADETIEDFQRAFTARSTGLRACELPYGLADLKPGKEATARALESDNRLVKPARDLSKLLAIFKL